MARLPGLYAQITTECGCGWFSETVAFKLRGGVWRGGRVIHCPSCGAVMEVITSIEDISEKEED